MPNVKGQETYRKVHKKYSKSCHTSTCHRLCSKKLQNMEVVQFDIVQCKIIYDGELFINYTHLLHACIYYYPIPIIYEELLLIS